LKLSIGKFQGPAQLKRLNQIDTYGHDPKDLAKVIGLKSRVSEINPESDQ